MNNENTSTKPSEMNPEDLPDVRAFNDEFTRDFLQSIEETREGYYPFLSGTGKYKMDFPAGGIIGEKGYALKSDNSEGYLIGIRNKNGTESSININYDSFKKADEVDSYLNNLKDRIGMEVEFKRLNGDDEGLLLYYTYYERNGFYSYAGYVQNKENTGGIQVIYKTKCTASKKECKEIKNNDKDRIIEWMKSVQFVSEDGK